MTPRHSKVGGARLIGLTLTVLAVALAGCTAAGQGEDGGAPDGGPPDGTTQAAEAGLEAGGGRDLAGVDQAMLPADGAAERDAAAGLDLGLDCTAPLGAATITGTVQGQSFGATHAAGLSFGSGIQGYMVFFVEQTSCAVLGQVPLPELGLSVCDTAPGTYPLNATCASTLPVVQTEVSVIRDGPDLKADSGTILIEVFEPGCGGRVRGSFEAEFSGEVVSGVFEATGCD